ncbi:hypothetical protein ACQR36_17475 [Rhodococcus erythropolis]|uniref:hypothetical protein n=1 Tax=Rhodococcus erythropolis TaxID=1833 RepID=UPI001E58349C|nr:MULTISPECIES: hypothetical protein [Rhodococcus erythropolis group]MCD2104913.1 hypothetical protein [Rhodococcus qingshengii]MCZ4526426.1 hypothetical protein [Rhodococcus erythropolis]
MSIPPESIAQPLFEVEREGKNFIAEYFGHRVYPEVAHTLASTEDQVNGECPFLSRAKATPTPCIKAESSRGVCVVSTLIDKERHDWLVCPQRVLDPTFMRTAARQIFGFDETDSLEFIAAPTLAEPEVRESIRAWLNSSNTKVVVFFQDKLGGELGISKTSTSPEFSFDWTLVEIEGFDPDPKLGRYGILEIQTMDFHGSYKHAVGPVSERRGDEDFHEWLGAPSGRAALSKKMEGPNISNVFKRTFYQMAYKFALGGHGKCAGTGFAIPQSVWISWLRHLANPALIDNGDGTHSLGDTSSETSNAWIFVFELHPNTTISPRPLRPYLQIRVNTRTLRELALVVSPQTALATGGPVDAVQDKLRLRMNEYWNPSGKPRRRRQT